MQVLSASAENDAEPHHCPMADRGRKVQRRHRHIDRSIARDTFLEPQRRAKL